MSYIYTALKPHLCKDVIGIIEDMVRWEGDAYINSCEDGCDVYYDETLLTINFIYEALNIGPSIIYDPNFTGEKPIALSDKYPQFANPCTITIECMLKRCDVYTPTTYPTITSYHLYILFKINESCYIFYKMSILRQCLYIANSLQILYDKYMDDNEKKAFFKLEELKE